MTLLALGAKWGGRGASGWVTEAASAPAPPAALPSAAFPASDASAIDPSPTWQRRRKWRRVTSLAYSWCRFIASPSYSLSHVRGGEGWGEGRPFFRSKKKPLALTLSPAYR